MKGYVKEWQALEKWQRNGYYDVTWHPVYSGVGLGVIAGAVPGNAGGCARVARGDAGQRAARAVYRLLRLHARRPRAQPLQQGRGRARQCAANDAARLDLLLLCGMLPPASSTALKDQPVYLSYLKQNIIQILTEIGQ